MPAGKTPLVGRRVRLQQTLRPTPPVKTLDEFLAFLRQIEATFGRTRRPRRITTGDRFLL